MILPLWSELNVCVSGLGIFEDFSFVIAEDDFFIVVIQNIARINRNLPAPAGGVDDELRHGVTGGVAAQAFDDLDSFRDRKRAFAPRKARFV